MRLQHFIATNTGTCAFGNVLISAKLLDPFRAVSFTFPQYAGLSNAQQTPKLPDWAILDLSVPLAERVDGKGVVAANFFGEQWEVKVR